MDSLVKHRNLPQLLAQARDAVVEPFRHILHHFELTEQQWRILRILDQEAPLEPWQICKRGQFLSPSLAGVLSRMEDMSLVQRRKLNTDQRRQLVTLTEQGRQLISAMAPVIEQQYEHIDAVLGANTVKQLYCALDKLLDLRKLDIRQADLPAQKFQHQRRQNAKKPRGNSSSPED
ncbi:MAG: homoprotocatechuate degradation operon regulator HpaR [Rhodocyclaceae bacterium]|nr:homoprotocatechuate degradation operon regulator HpaR [Rhodocyclaceae bacterium]MBX3669780.1 homoprotocatechuate degradation operon regulator HpaR [Rhodocyclaceae bacterium]